MIAAGVGSSACGVFYVLGGVKQLSPLFTLYPPSGALSGVSTAAILIWLATWFLLVRIWKNRDVNLRLASRVSIVLLLLGLLLTFPPLARML